jgi:hypothetical protein
LQSAIIGSFAVFVAYIHIGVGFGVVRSTTRAMPEPRCVGRVTDRLPRFFVSIAKPFDNRQVWGVGLALNSLRMGKVRCSVENDRLGIYFEDRIRAVFIKGQTEGGVFYVRTEDFETFPGLSDSDRRDIRDALTNSNIVID